MFHFQLQTERGKVLKFHTWEKVRSSGLPFDIQLDGFEATHALPLHRFWYSEEQCALIGHPVFKDESPVGFLHIGGAKDLFVALYNREYLKERTLRYPYESHLMTKHDIASRFLILPRDEIGNYEDPNIRFAAIGEYGEFIYDVSNLPKYKSWRLKELFIV